MSNEKTGKPFDVKASIESIVNEDDQPNIPRSGYNIIDLDIRSQGGRAYKVVSPDNYYFDLREDVVIDIMLNTGIRKGGIIPCKLLWVKLGSQIRLIRDNSKMHKEIIEYQNEKKKK